MPAWTWAVFAITVGANLLAGGATQLTIDTMRSVTEFADAVYRDDRRVILYLNLVAYPLVLSVCLAYLLPLIRWFRTPEASPSDTVRRRALEAPFVVACFSFAPWAFSLLFFPIRTCVMFGHWSTELMSQQVLSPLVNGFLAATASYFLIDLVFRSRVVPRVFVDSPLTAIRSSATLGLRTRLGLFLVAVAFLPLFTMLGLARGAGNRLLAGVPESDVIPLLNDASSATFVLYLALGVGLTVVLSRSLTRPLREVTLALDRIQRGDLNVVTRPTTNDEVGIVEQGVNAMVAALRDRERILQTFGRVVEPAVRDRLLDGEVRPGGELRLASVLFCDLRGFTSYAEGAPPHEVVETLNQFFTAMTSRVRDFGGFVDKFIGDAILVVFGLFDDGREQGVAGAAAAVRCAAAMVKELDVLNASRRAAGQAPLAVAGAIHSGEVVAGTIGAHDRHEFTVVGDTVNVAARLQETCKARGWQFLVSEAAVDLARRDGAGFQSQDCDAVALRGRLEPVRVFRLS